MSCCAPGFQEMQQLHVPITFTTVVVAVRGLHQPESLQLYA